MLLFCFLIGWIVGISTMGMNLPPLLLGLMQICTWLSTTVFIFAGIHQLRQKLNQKKPKLNKRDTTSSKALSTRPSHNHVSQSGQTFLSKRAISSKKLFQAYVPLLAKLSFTLSLMLSGAWLGYLYADHALSERLQHRIQQITTLTEVVYVHKLNEVVQSPDQTSIKQKVTVLREDPKQSFEILLYLKHADDERTLDLGGYYAVTGKIKPTHGYAVAGVFDLEKWHVQQNIMGSMQVSHVQALTALDLQDMNLYGFVQQQQGWLNKIQLKAEQTRLNFRLMMERQPLSNKGLLLALLTGDESLLSKSTTMQFQRLGISHLLAISGPHVLIFAVMFCFVVHQIISRFCPSIFLKIPRPYFLVIPFLSCVLAYTAFVGFEIPALRTCLTVCIISLVILLKQKVHALSLLIWSASILLLLDPFSILSAAFWLSYGACFILIRVYQTINQRQHSEPLNSSPLLAAKANQDGLNQATKAKQEQSMQANAGQVKTWQGQIKLFVWVLVDSQWKVFIALFPLVAIIFQKISWISPLINLIAIPIMGSIVVPLEVLGAFVYSLIPELGLFCFHLADWSLSLLLRIFEFLEVIFQPKLQWLALSPWMLLAITLATIIVFLPRGILPKSWALLCLLPLIFVHKASHEFELSVIDVGQGQAVFIKLPEQHILIDTGGTFDETRFSVGENVIVPFLMRQGVSKLDQLFLTHLDQDHAGAFESIAKHIAIDRVYSNENDQRFNSHTFEYCHAGMEWMYDQVHIQVLAPEVSSLNTVHLNRNETSCVFYIQVKQAQHYKNFLIMGDAGWESEFALLQQYPNLAVDVLILGHHGSQHSSSYGFLKRLNPKMSIASAGFDNRYGHPSPIVKARLAALSIPFESTIDSGSLMFQLDRQQNMQMIRHRHSKKWLHPSFLFQHESAQF